MVRQPTTKSLFLLMTLSALVFWVMRNDPSELAWYFIGIQSIRQKLLLFVIPLCVVWFIPIILSLCVKRLWVIGGLSFALYFTVHIAGVWLSFYAKNRDQSTLDVAWYCGIELLPQTIYYKFIPLDLSRPWGWESEGFVERYRLDGCLMFAALGPLFALTCHTRKAGDHEPSRDGPKSSSGTATK